MYNKKHINKAKKKVEELSGEEIFWEGIANNKIFFKAVSKYVHKNEYYFDYNTEEIYCRKILSDQVGEVGEFKKLVAGKKVEMVTGDLRPKHLVHLYEDGSMKVKNSGRWLPSTAYNQENQALLRRAFEEAE